MRQRSRPTEYERRLAAQAVRPLHAWEQELLQVLAAAAGLPDELTTPSAFAGYRVRDMLDGGMGSIRFVPSADGPRRFGVAELWYRDADGTEVSFALNLDARSWPYEIDAWKVDSSPLVRPPSGSELRAAPSG